MGKSPGKWLKTILLGKKSSKSNLPKGREALKAANEKETWVTAKASNADMVISPPLVTQTAPGTADRNGGNLVLERGASSNIPGDEIVISSQNQDEDRQGTARSGYLNDQERIRQEQAATKAQAAFRGYLARRAFRALRGIIRLQALIRGHLVRRQAVVTLRCIQGIVKLQALVRGQRVKISNVGLDVHKKLSVRKSQDAKRSDSNGVNPSTRTEKLPANALVIKLLGSSSKGMPLQLQYGPEEPNSAWVWLERWTSSRFWVPLLQPKKAVDSKSQMKQGTFQNVGTEPSRSKRVIRKAPTVNVDSGSTLSTSESEKPKRYLRKVSSHPVDPVPENPQNELEKVKRNLRKVSNSTVDPTDQPETETEKPKRGLRKPSNYSPDIPDHAMAESAEKMKKLTTVAVTEQHDNAIETEKLNSSARKESSSPTPDVLEQGIDQCTEKMKDATETVSRQLPVEPTLESLTDGSVNVSNDDHPPGELPPLETSGKDENVPVKSRDSISKEDQTNNDNQKASKRRTSFPAKQENLDNGLQNTPPIPSYMAATESAKAKLRAQGSPRFVQEVVEKNGFTRRHSLPSSTNGKLSTPSPRTQKVHGSGKAGTKNDRSLLSSRDGNEKVVQAEWRR